MDNLDLGILLRKIQDDLLGYVLDLARISPMSDRQFEQFSKSVKREFRETIDSTVEMLREQTNFSVSERPPYVHESVQNKEK